jgi:hypothetical protein
MPVFSQSFGLRRLPLRKMRRSDIARA